MFARQTRHRKADALAPQMAPKKISNAGSKHRLVTISLPANEFDWLNEFVTTLEGAGYRRTRSAVVCVALAELRGSIPNGPPNEILKHWLRRNAERVIAALDDNRVEPERPVARLRRVPK